MCKCSPPAKFYGLYTVNFETVFSQNFGKLIEIATFNVISRIGVH